MAYLLPSEYVKFGLGADTADVWVAAASAMVEAHCRRSSLLATSYTERIRISRRGTAQLTYGPVAQITALKARYRAASACTGSRNEGFMAEAGFAGASLSELAVVLGLPGQWTSIDISSLEADPTSGEVQLPGNAWQMPYSEVEVTYTAGMASVPDAVKFAVAQVVKNAQSTPGLNVKSSKLDALQTQYFSDSLLDAQTKALLRPYVAERLG